MAYQSRWRLGKSEIVWKLETFGGSHGWICLCDFDGSDVCGAVHFAGSCAEAMGESEQAGSLRAAPALGKWPDVERDAWLCCQNDIKLNSASSFGWSQLAKASDDRFCPQSYHGHLILYSITHHQDMQRIESEIVICSHCSFGPACANHQRISNNRSMLLLVTPANPLYCCQIREQRKTQTASTHLPRNQGNLS